jgi:ferredoxin
MRVALDQDRCIAAGQCVAAAPDVFDQRDEDGVVVLLKATPDADEEDDVRRAAVVCPALAIQVQG